MTEKAGPSQNRAQYARWATLKRDTNRGTHDTAYQPHAALPAARRWHGSDAGRCPRPACRTGAGIL